jgi:hypothetical protein
LIFEKNANFFFENWQKSQKIVIISSTPDCANLRRLGKFDCLQFLIKKLGSFIHKKINWMKRGVGIHIGRFLSQAHLVTLNIGRLDQIFCPLKKWRLRSMKQR